ncbi:MAG TPA: Calx-beta domain-containing protein [Pyrinomonadaceae bacterium]
MQDAGRRHRRSVILSFVLLSLTGWFALPGHFRNRVAPTASAQTGAFTVNTTNDTNDGVCTIAHCSLREAINAANNSTSRLNTIRFDIGGTSHVKTISPASALPAVNGQVVIDGTTQPGYAGTPLVELNGAGAGAGANGLTLKGEGSTVKGLAVNRFGVGISLGGNGGHTVRGNYLGTNAAGATGIGNVVGVAMAGSAANNTVGGATAAERNVISGNRGNGISIRDAGSTGNKVQGNFIGTDPSGNSILANSGTGIRIDLDAANNVIGGASVGERNVISGNGSSGIFIAGAHGNQVEGNYIGTNAAGTGGLGNTFSGVHIGADSSSNSVKSNTIAFNTREGVFVQSGTANHVVSNAIHSNGGLGIDLGADGVTPNDAGDGDAGANNLQNFPVLTSATYAGGRLAIAGTHDRSAGFYSYEFFASASCDPSGNGEGERLITTFGGGGSNGGITNFVIGRTAPLPAGRFITATATRVNELFENPSDTSEFSPCVRITMPGSLQFSAAAYNADEGAGTAAVSIDRVGGSEGATTVFFITSDGTATAGQDYTDTEIPVSFAAGETSKTVLVPIADDNSPEGSETVNLTLLQATGGAPVGTPSAAVLTINDNDSGSVFHLSDSNYGASEDCAAVNVIVHRVGDTSGTSTVSYATASGTASERADFNAALGTLRFNPGETEKSFVLLVNEDSHTDGTETASVTLSNPANASLGGPSTATLSIFDDASEPAANASDDSAKFVCQHYHDFLNRQPDAGGQAFWTNEIEQCGASAECREAKRVNVSAAFFLSIEFQETGYLVYRMYKAAYGNLVGAPVPLTLPEFLPDTQRIGQGVEVGVGDWQARLAANKAAFAGEFVARARFTTAYPAGMSAAQFVDTLNANSGGALSPGERNQLVAELTAGAKSRAEVLRAVAEDETLAQSESNRAFVLMQYFGYLRRSPNSAPDTDYGGYTFWLQKLNQFGGNFVNAEMVKAFISSIEYRRRFGQ